MRGALLLLAMPLLLAPTSCGSGDAVPSDRASAVRSDLDVAACGTQEPDAATWFASPTRDQVWWPEFQALSLWFSGLEWTQLPPNAEVPFTDTGEPTDPDWERWRSAHGTEGEPLHWVEVTDEAIAPSGTRLSAFPSSLVDANAASAAGDDVWIGVPSAASSSLGLRLVVVTDAQVIPVGGCWQMTAAIRGVPDQEELFEMLRAGDVDGAVSLLEAAWRERPGTTETTVAWQDRPLADRHLLDAPVEVWKDLEHVTVAIQVDDALANGGSLVCTRSPLGMGVCLDPAAARQGHAPGAFVEWSTVRQKGAPLEFVLQDEAGTYQTVILTVDAQRAGSPVWVRNDGGQFSVTTPQEAVSEGLVPDDGSHHP